MKSTWTSYVLMCIYLVCAGMSVEHNIKKPRESRMYVRPTTDEWAAGEFPGEQPFVLPDGEPEPLREENAKEFPFLWSMCGLRSRRPSFESTVSSSSYLERYEYGNKRARLIDNGSSRPIEKGEFPWLLHMFVEIVFKPRADGKVLENMEVVFCGASLVASRYGLTAKHCTHIQDEFADKMDVIQELTQHVAVATFFLTGKDFMKNQTLADKYVRTIVEEIGDETKFDIAIIKFDAPYEYEYDNETDLIVVNTVCLPVKGQVPRFYVHQVCMLYTFRIAKKHVL